jgi:hypothetical protein
MDKDQEIRARALEIAVAIIGPSHYLASFDWESRYSMPMSPDVLHKYEFVADLIEQDIRKGYGNETEHSNLFDRMKSFQSPQ